MYLVVTWLDWSAVVRATCLDKRSRLFVAGDFPAVIRKMD